jgi:integrase
MTVKLRADKLSKGRKSLYLDIYVDQKTTQKRLGIYLLPEKTISDKKRNQEHLRLAEIIRNEYESDLLNKRLGKDKPQEKFNNCFVEYFDSMVKSRYETGVNYNTWMSVQKHLIEFTKGSVKFDDVNENWLESFKSFLLNKKLANNSCHNYFNKIKRAIHTAYRERIIDRNPANYVSAPKETISKREFLTEEELKRLSKEECRIPIMKRAFFFSVLTGLRWSDVQNLKWKDVRVDNGECFLVFTQRKTKDSERLPINEEALSLLKDRGEDLDRVFVGLKYSAWNNMALSQWMIKADIKKHITFHCARHTNATLLLNSGVDIFTVSKMLGHREVRTTQVYAKLANKAKVEAISKLPKLI